MAECVAFELEHIEQIRVTQNDRQAWEEYSGRADFASLLAAGPAFTLVHDGEVIGCGGVAILWHGVGHVWMALTRHVQEHRFAFLRACRDRFRDIAAEHKLHRLQASVDCADDLACKFTQHMGLKREGLMRSYGPDGRDHYMYAMTRE